MTKSLVDRIVTAALCVALISSQTPTRALAEIGGGQTKNEGASLIVLDEGNEDSSGEFITIDDTSVVELPLGNVFAGDEPVEDVAAGEGSLGEHASDEQGAVNEIVGVLVNDQDDADDSGQRNAASSQDATSEGNAMLPADAANPPVTRTAPNDDWGPEVQAPLSKREQYDLGAYGFYHWLANTYKPSASMSWIASDARDAMKVINQSVYSAYTKKGAKGDATSHKNFKVALNMLPTLNQLRKQDNNFKDLLMARVNSTMMAVAQVHANVSSVTKGHAVDETVDVPLALLSGENLAWVNDGTDGGPFDIWYHKEKMRYEAYRDHILEKTKIDINDGVQLHDYCSLPEDIRYDDSFGELGDYANIVMRGSVDWDNSSGEWRIGMRPYEQVLGGIACNKAACATWSLELNGLEKDDVRSRGSCTIDEYAKLYEEYLTWVRADVSDAEVVGISEQTYTGMPLKPKLVVKQDGRTLKAGTDYSVTYKNNVKVGTATATIKGKGAYRGSKSVTFQIVG
ncbi:MAG: hypothetical protein IKF14_08795 [Atopobiaceae bacterium]|nr:hypothetical protein [Atopobiaceae bacterium]